MLYRAKFGSNLTSNTLILTSFFLWSFLTLSISFHTDQEVCCSSTEQKLSFFLLWLAAFAVTLAKGVPVAP